MMGEMIIFVILFKFFINSVSVNSNTVCDTVVADGSSTFVHNNNNNNGRPTASTVVALYDKAAFIFDFGSFLRIEYNHDESFSYQMFQSLSSDRITYNNCKGNVFVTR